MSSFASSRIVRTLFLFGFLFISNKSYSLDPIIRFGEIPPPPFAQDRNEMRRQAEVVQNAIGDRILKKNPYFFRDVRLFCRTQRELGQGNSVPRGLLKNDLVALGTEATRIFLNKVYHKAFFEKFSEYLLELFEKKHVKILKLLKKMEDDFKGEKRLKVFLDKNIKFMSFKALGRDLFVPFLTSFFGNVGMNYLNYNVGEGHFIDENERYGTGLRLRFIFPILRAIYSVIHAGTVEGFRGTARNVVCPVAKAFMSGVLGGIDDSVGGKLGVLCRELPELLGVYVGTKNFAAYCKSFFKEYIIDNDKELLEILKSYVIARKKTSVEKLKEARSQLKTFIDKSYDVSMSGVRHFVI